VTPAVNQLQALTVMQQCFCAASWRLETFTNSITDWWSLDQSVAQRYRRCCQQMEKLSTCLFWRHTRTCWTLLLQTVKKYTVLWTVSQSH